jgi:pSer/pThr/pTyr-binding forkhead associated (FHA) protein/MFS family permease
VKRCPACQREFTDKYTFCDRDGTRLTAIGQTIRARLIIRMPDGGERDVALASDVCSIGKTPENEVVISDGAISRKHAVLERREDRFFIKDLASLNGTFVNGQRLGEAEQELNDRDEVMIGRTRALFLLTPDISQIETLESSQVDHSTLKDVPVPVSPLPQRQTAPPQPEPPALTPPPKLPIPPPPPPPQLTKPPVPETPPAKYRVADTGELKPQKDGESNRLVIDGRYELEEKLSQDEKGTLYRARRLMLNDQVAVRVLRPELLRYPMAIERFRRQAQVAARIKHPNSVQVYDFSHSPGGAAYIVEELLQGRTLRDLINEERGLSLARVIDIINQICGAVHTAHLNGFVLRDLRPETIFVERDAEGKETIKLGSYALVKVDETFLQEAHGRSLTGPLGVYGLPQYASPEQLTNQKLDSRSDVYSLGVILFELLTGALPFDSSNPAELVAMHLSTAAPDVTEYGRSDLDEGVAAVVSRALAKTPDQRQASALQLAEELLAVSGARGGLIGTLVSKATGLLPFAPPIVSQKTAVPAGEESLPSVVPEVKGKGHGAFNSVVMALMAEAFLSRISSGLIKMAVPLYALLVFGMKITTVMVLVLIQNIVPLLLRPVFGTLADKYGKKNVFMISLIIRTAASLLYAVATLPLLFIVSAVRGIADSAKGPSASAMIADHTDEKHIAQAYSWYTTTKSTSGGIGEALAAFALVVLLTWFAGVQSVNVNVAVLEKTKRSGANVEEIVKAPNQVVNGFLPGDERDPNPRRVLRVEQRPMRLSAVPIDDLPKVIDATPLRKTLVAIFLASTLLSLGSLILVFIFIKEKKKEKKKDKKEKSSAQAEQSDAPREEPNVWSFALLGMALTAPAYMVTGEFFIILAVKLEVTPGALGWIKIIAETMVPLLFGPFFGWLADRIGAGKVIALRSVANLLTSFLFWIVPWFAGGALLGMMMGLARGIDEIGKAAFKPTWGAIAAKVSSYNLSRRSKTMGILEGGVDASDLAFPVIAGAMLQYLSLGPLMIVRGILAILAEVYGFFLMRKYKI